jgi:hypothetical protein
VFRDVLIALALVACQDQRAAAPASSEAWPSEFRGWAYEPRLAAWQGAWLLPGFERHGKWLAIEVTGTKLRLFDGGEERTGRLELLSPCLVKVTEDRDDAQYQFAYALRETGELIATKAGYAVGARRGDDAIVCLGTSIVTRINGACVRWDPYRGTHTATECSWNADSFRAAGTDVPADGDVLLEPDHAPRSVPRATKHADFDAAKLARTRN